MFIMFVRPMSGSVIKPITPQTESRGILNNHDLMKQTHFQKSNVKLYTYNQAQYNLYRSASPDP